ncbi:hypothetical protein HYG86_14315 [Alkalicella caledoniensis]|uniref:Uncharacterized protein n=1 Tax=Alkalicella caledoniensis TaxID=2731377 RepID=A0A7G9WAZ5_ALKCA|nr:hypothetical protein [Alkalicella caledoniensis]QNO15857.1 hypothetical protein HYG86_14315 [Alkalicella caledoniensis]
MEVIKEIYSLNKDYMAEVVKRKDGLYQVYVFVWDDEWDTWLQVTEGLSLTDNLQSAIGFAVEQLKNRGVVVDL